MKVFRPRPLWLLSLFSFLHAVPVSGATFSVVNTDDLGSGSLRQAIVSANAAANPVGEIDRIEFNIPF